MNEFVEVEIHEKKFQGRGLECSSMLSTNRESIRTSNRNRKREVNRAPGCGFGLSWAPEVARAERRPSLPGSRMWKNTVSAACFWEVDALRTPLNFKSQAVKLGCAEGAHFC